MRPIAQGPRGRHRLRLSGCGAERAGARGLHDRDRARAGAAAPKRCCGTLNRTNVHVRAGDGYAGWPEQAPFDRIMVTAAPEEIPRPLIDQLAPGGRLVAPGRRPGRPAVDDHRREDRERRGRAADDPRPVRPVYAWEARLTFPRPARNRGHETNCHSGPAALPSRSRQPRRGAGPAGNRARPPRRGQPAQPIDQNNQLPRQNAEETRQMLQQMLWQLPPAVRGVLQYDPSLLDRPDYLGPYPELQAFLKQHPEVCEEPGVLFREPRQPTRQ